MRWVTAGHIESEAGFCIDRSSGSRDQRLGRLFHNRLRYLLWTAVCRLADSWLATHFFRFHPAKEIWERECLFCLLCLELDCSVDQRLCVGLLPTSLSVSVTSVTSPHECWKEWSSSNTFTSLACCYFGHDLFACYWLNLWWCALKRDVT